MHITIIKILFLSMIEKHDKEYTFKLKLFKFMHFCMNYDFVA